MAEVGPGDTPRVIVVMGVSGSGKSTIGTLLAARLGWDFADGDDLHPAANVAKMAAGHPLDDADRRPWLANVAEWIERHLRSERPGVIACSALRRAYRDALRGEGVVFVYLAGSREQIRRRLVARHGHYMPATLLDSQLDALEPPGRDECAIAVDIGPDAPEIVAGILDRLGLAAGR